MTAKIPTIEFTQGNSEDIDASWVVRYAAPASFFNGAKYLLLLANSSGVDAVAFSSESNAINKCEISVSPYSGAPDTVSEATFRLRAPWRSFFSRIGTHSGNWQIECADGKIYDLVIVSLTIEKRPTCFGSKAT